jgi:hypothetical protein
METLGQVFTCFVHGVNSGSCDFRGVIARFVRAAQARTSSTLFWSFRSRAARSESDSRSEKSSGPVIVEGEHPTGKG